MTNGNTATAVIGRAKKENVPNRVPMQTDAPPQRLVEARFIRPAGISLSFADGFTARIQVACLEMPIDRIKWESTSVSTNGDGMTVEGITGDTIPISSATLRYLADPVYAAKIEAEVDAVTRTKDELTELSRESKPPQSWYEQPEQVLTRDSWK